MHFVIGNGQPGLLDFTICCGPAIPKGARIYATFSGKNEHIDEHLFNTMTEEEYYSFCALAQEARQREAGKRKAQNSSPASLLVAKVRGWFPGRRIVAHPK